MRRFLTKYISKARRNLVSYIWGLLIHGPYYIQVMSETMRPVASYARVLSELRVLSYSWDSRLFGRSWLSEFNPTPARKVVFPPDLSVRKSLHNKTKKHTAAKQKGQLPLPKSGEANLIPTSCPSRGTG